MGKSRSWGWLGFGEGREKKKRGRRKRKEAPRSRGKEETVNCVGGARGRGGLFWVFGKKATLKGVRSKSRGQESRGRHGRGALGGDAHVQFQASP